MTCLKKLFIVRKIHTRPTCLVNENNILGIQGEIKIILPIIMQLILKAKLMHNPLTCMYVRVLLHV